MAWRVSVPGALLLSMALHLVGCGEPGTAARPAVSPSPPAVGGGRTMGQGSLPGDDPLADWPLVIPGVESRQFSSFDRTGGNDDGFSGAWSALYVDASGEHVLFDALGPGRLNTLWFTGGETGREVPQLGNVRFYFDDEPFARADLDAARLFSGTAAGFPSDLVFDTTRSTGGFASVVPMPFSRRLRITTTERPYFYSAQYDTFPSDWSTTSWRPDAAVAWPPRPGGAGASPAEETVPLDYGYTGSGTIESLALYPKETSGQSLSDARIRISWDDQAAPAVDCPLDAFFGSGLGMTEVGALAFSMRGGASGPELVSHFRMPFWKGFRITVTGVEGRIGLRIGPERYTRADTGYFNAVCASGESPGSDFSYVSRGGAGTLVGTVLTVRPGNAALEKGWWEGDLRSYADGRRTPSIHGTGHEDDHLGGWSSEFLLGPFSLLMNGLPKVTLLDERLPYNGDATMYRLFPGLHYLSGIEHGVERGVDNRSRATYSAATFLYASDRPWLVDSDLLEVCDAASRGAHSYEAAQEAEPQRLESGFEGRDHRSPVAGCVAGHSGPATFQMAVGPGNAGVYLRRLFDQTMPRQRATVSVDGQVVGDWYVAEGNPALRWAERDFFVPKRFTAGKQRLIFRITPAASAPPWSACEYRTLSVIVPESAP